MATKLKVAGVDVVAMGLEEPERPDDEFVQFSEPSRGVYQTVIIREGILVGATLLGDVSKVASLTHAFDRRVPLPEERVKLLFDIGVPSAEVGAAELADDAQVCNCNGVSKGALVACVRDGQRTVSGVMAATRAGRGCGSCKALVAGIVTAVLGDDLQTDPAESYYVPCIPLDKPALMAEIRARGLRSPSAVFAALAVGGKWEIYIGGAAGASVRKGDLLATVDRHDDAVTLTGRFIQYYRENAKWLERTYDFVPRIGLAELQAILVEDRDGITAELDAAVARSAAAYRDPWQEHATPATEGQFRTALPLIEIPVP